MFENIMQTLKELFSKLFFIQRQLNTLLTPDQILQLIKNKAKKYGVVETSQIFKNGLATLKWESHLDCNTVCFNLINKKALSGVFIGENKLIESNTDIEYILDREKRTLTNKDVVINYKSWDRGIAQWNDKAWPEISDALAFNPSVALDWFWKIFKDSPNTWVGYKTGFYKNYL
jgi:hypothetical protein